MGNLIESYYRATAEIFTCSVGGALQSQESLQEQAVTVLNALKEIGFDLELDREKITRLVEVQKERNGCCGQEQFMDEISKLEDVDPFTKLIVEKYATLIEMSDDEFRRQQELDRKFRELLISLKK